MPEAPHSLGNIEISVNPGMVFVSLISTRPSSATNKSTRDSPAAPIALKAVTA